MSRKKVPPSPTSLQKLPKNGRVHLASDHAGFPLKEALKGFMADLGVRFEDHGCHGENSVDYPFYARKICEKITAEGNGFGVLICGTGIGMSISANRFPNVRAALCHDAETARLSRLHNDANVLTLGARVLSTENARNVLETWLNTAFEEGRHVRRIRMIETLASE